MITVPVLRKYTKAEIAALLSELQREIDRNDRPWEVHSAMLARKERLLWQLRRRDD